MQSKVLGIIQAKALCTGCYIRFSYFIYNHIMEHYHQVNSQSSLVSKNIFAGGPTSFLL